ncbi:MAG: hypothetical protein PPP58_00320 [Natronomonas sp.]
MSGSSGSEAESFGAAVVRSSHPIDIVALGLIPTVSIVAFLFSSGPTPEVVFSYENPTLRTAVVAHFFHTGFDHLLSNLVRYSLVILTVYLLSTLADRRCVFYILFTGVLLAFPPVISIMNLAVPRDGVLIVAPGLVMAGIGLLPVMLGEYLDRRFDLNPTSDIAGFLFLIGLTITALSAVPDAFRWVALPAAVGSVGYAVSVVRTGIDTGRFRDAPPGYLEFGFWSVGLFVFLVVTAFSAGIVDDGTIVNTYVHFIGYALGFLSSYLTVLLADLDRPQRIV